MKLKLFFSFFLALILSFVFFGANSASATVLYSATATSTNFTDGPLSYDLFLVGTSSQPLTSGDDLWMVYYSDVATDDFELGIILGSSTYAVWDTAPYTSYLSNLTELSNTSTLVSSGVYRHVVALDVATTVSDTDYWFSIRHSDGGQGEDVMVSSGSTSYTSVYGNTSIYDKTSRAIACISTLTNATDCSFAPSVSELTTFVLFPKDISEYASSNKPYFTNWLLSINNIVSSTPTFSYGIEYDYRSSSTFGFQSSAIYPDIGRIGDNLFVIPFNKQYPLLNYSDHWFARSWILEGTTFTYSDVIEFYVSSSAPDYPSDWFLPTATTSYAGLNDQNYNAPKQTSCHNEYLMCLAENNIEFATSGEPIGVNFLTWESSTWPYFKCNYLSFARDITYCASEESKSFVADNLSNVTKGFPFNIIFGTLEAMDSLAKLSTPATSLALDMGSDIGVLTFATSGTMSSAIGESDFYDIQIFASYLLKAGAFMAMLFALL